MAATRAWWRDRDNWAWIGKQVGTGALQATGAVLLYALVLFLVIKQYVKVKVLEQAIQVRAGPMTSTIMSKSAHGLDDRAAPA